MTAGLRAHWAFARIAFMQILAYRMRYVTGILTYTFYVSAYVFLWRAIYGDRSEMGGMGIAELARFIAVGWILRSFYFNNIDRELASEVREGKIGAALLRPVSYPLSKLSASVGESVFRLAFFTVPIAAAVGLFFGLPLPAGWKAGLGGVASAFLALLVMGGMNFLVGLAAFSMQNAEGLVYAKHAAVQLLSGLFIPLTFFPEPASSILQALPFASISQAPVSIYLGRMAASEAWGALAVQALWAAVLWGLSAWLWGRSVRRLTIQGG